MTAHSLQDENLDSAGTIRVHGKLFRKYISSADIAAKVSELSRRIDHALRDHNPLFIGVLDGAFYFMADLLRHFDFEYEIGFIKVSSYEGLQSSGQLSEKMPMTQSPAGRHIVFVEDIIDSGRTMAALIKRAQAAGAASVSVASLIVKPKAMITPLPVDYPGFEAANEFLVGYGMDYDGVGRHLPDIYQLSE